MEVTHDRTAFPSIRTVQAPQRPSPQTYLLPVKSRSSRRTLRRLRSVSVWTECFAPLTWKSVTRFIGTLRSRRSRNLQQEETRGTEGKCSLCLLCFLRFNFLCVRNADAI